MYNCSIHRQEGPRQQRWLILSMWLMLLGLFLPPWTQAQAPAASVAHELSKTFTQVSQQALPAVVLISVGKTVEIPQLFSFDNPANWFSAESLERFFRQRDSEQEHRREFRQEEQGSGFIISQDGLILTNHHVVSNAARITVKLADGREFNGKTVGIDPASDIAVIRIAVQGLPALPLGNSDAMEVGDWVIAAGNPFGLTHTITVGVISAKGRSQLGVLDFEDFIQTDAAINHGHSGGPLINLRGEAIGVNTAIVSDQGGYMGIGFAIPINLVQTIQKQLVAQGKVVRGFLGMRLQELTRELAESFNLETTTGALVVDVASGSPADKAGLQQGDVILSFNNQPVQYARQLRNMVAMTPPGIQARVELLRNNQQQGLTVELGELPGAQTAAAGEERQPSGQPGFSVQNLMPELAGQLGYDGTGGVIVAKVDPDSEAYQAGLRRGMLIRQVNHQVVSNTEEFWQALARSEQTKRVLLLVQDPQTPRYIAFRLVA
jgi:serine protease Do